MGCKLSKSAKVQGQVLDKKMEKSPDDLAKEQGLWDKKNSVPMPAFVERHFKTIRKGERETTLMLSLLCKTRTMCEKGSDLFEKQVRTFPNFLSCK